LESHEWDSLAELSYSLYPYWWLVGLLGEIRGRLDELLTCGDPVSDRATAIALWLASVVTFFQGGDETSTESLVRSARLFAAAGDDIREGSALPSLGHALAPAVPPDPPRAMESPHRP